MGSDLKPNLYPWPNTILVFFVQNASLTGSDIVDINHFLLILPGIEIYDYFESQFEDHDIKKAVCLFAGEQADNKFDI